MPDLSFAFSAPQPTWEARMPGFSLSSASTQYVQVPVRAWNQGTIYDPTALTVYMAFVTSGTPSASDWNAAEWAWTATDLGSYAAQCLVGPGSTAVSLAVGPYGVWVKVDGTPEVPVIAVGALSVTP